MNKQNTLIAVATAWGPKYGGINAFNYDLLIAIAAAHWSWLRVVCVVAECADDEIRLVWDQYQIELISLELTGGSIGKEHATLVRSKLQSKGLGEKSDEIVFLGHDRITGAAAIELARTHGGRSALIHHMSYAHYESFAEDSATSKSKESEQRQLFTDSNICLAVGPLLQSAAANMLDRRSTDIPMLIPGLAEISPRRHHNTFVAFVSGRLDAGAQKIKQAHLGVAGFAYAVHQCDSNSGLPDALRGENEPRIILRGIELEETPNTDSTGAEVELKELAQQHAGRVISLQALPFTQNRTELFDELKAASVCLMPSWHEGFGLVAWEAIAAGVPLILSQKSGAYHFLKMLRKENLVHAIDVKGQNGSPFFAKADKEAVANLLIEIAKNYSSVRADALRLREELQNDYHWRACADTFIAALDWHTPTASAIAPPPQVSPATTTPPIATNLAQWLALPAPLWNQHSGLSPSQLLKAEEALIPFAQERFQFLQTQLNWAKTSAYPACVRLLTGEGGSGKTRLALEMCKCLLKEGWAAGFLKGDFQTQSAQSLAKALSKSQQPVLLVIDYAETRTTELLGILAAVLSQNAASPIRFLLLARSSGEWWRQLPMYETRCEALLDGFATTGPYSLPGLYEQVSERNKAFNQALTAFAKALNVTSPNIQPDLSAEQYHSPLFLQMAALLTLLGERTANAEALPQSLVRHEQRYWYKVAANSSCESEANLMMSLVTLIGYASTAKAIEPLWVAADGQQPNLKPLFTGLTPLYPGRQGLGALQPDLLGEALIGHQVLGSEGGALLDAVLGEKASVTQRTHALTILARLLRYRSAVSTPLEIALSKNFARCAQPLFQVCIQTPSPLFLVAERSFKRLSPTVALQVAGLLEQNFKYEVLPLAGLELLIRETINTQAERRCQKVKASIGDWNIFSKTLLNLSIANRQLGKTAQALNFSKQSLDIRQWLAKNNPERFEPGLASSLSNYASHLSDVEDITQALVFAKQALDIHQRLAKNNPGHFEPNLASSLGNYANHLSDAGDSMQALEFSKQALDIHQRLAKDTPERFEPDFASSLSNYASHLSDVGETTQALDFSKQALDIRQRLAKDMPERFEPNLASSLSNYASHLSEVEDTTQALDFAKQALDIHQRLAKDKPERFEPNLASSLLNYANHLSDFGDAIQAIEFSRQALDIHQRLTKDNPERFEAALASSFGNYANHLSYVGETTQALDFSKLAFDIRKRLAKDNPERFEPDLAKSLNNYANHLSDIGDITQALDFSKQALLIYERLANVHRAKFAADALNSQLTVTLLTWLVDGRNLLAPSSEPCNAEEPYLMRPARFYQFMLLALGRQEPSEIASSMDAVWDSWNAMSKSQQTHCDSQYLVICAYAQANACLDSRFSNWPQQLEAFDRRRNDKRPQWMAQVAKRKSFAIGVEHTN
ncbi:tetratricopeptide repeat protein [Comamonas sp. lk]|uniref:tetratricopeptide repeat protein n=1 Tax=Comamonas sp. lk TaxID=2201272 RepID=UPI000EB2B0E9|nr:tetratricopeptide repeat protein [Comamonas sp. lk]